MKKTGKIVLVIIAVICLFKTNIVKSQNVMDLTGEQCYQMYLHYEYGVDIEKDPQKATYYLNLSREKDYKPPVHKGLWQYWFSSTIDYRDVQYGYRIYYDSWTDEQLQNLANTKCYSSHHNKREVIEVNGKLIEVDCLCIVKKRAQETLKKRQEDRHKKEKEIELLNKVKRQ